MKGGAIVDGGGVALAKVEGKAATVGKGRGAEVVASGALSTMSALMASPDMLTKW